MSHFYLSRSDNAKWENSSNGIVIWAKEKLSQTYNVYSEFGTNFFARSSEQDRATYPWGGYWNRHNVTPSVHMMSNNITSYYEGPFTTPEAQQDAVHYAIIQTFMDYPDTWMLFDFILSYPLKGPQSIDITAFVLQPELSNTLHDAINSYRSLGEEIHDPLDFLKSFTPIMYHETPIFC